MKRGRIIQLDWVRALAILCVVLCHAVEIGYGASFSEILEMPAIAKVPFLTLFFIGRIGVPLFLFLTGFLLLRKDFSEPGKIMEFYKKKLLPLIIIWFIWIIIYNFYNHLVLDIPFSPRTFLENIFFVRNVDVLLHVWYMPMIIGMYLFIPMVSLALPKLSGKHLLIIMGLVFFKFFLIDYLRNVFNDSQYAQLDFLPDMSFSGGIYGLYIIIGYCFWRFKNVITTIAQKKPYQIILVITGLICFLLQIQASVSMKLPIWYDTPLLLIESVIIFSLFLAHKAKPGRKYHLSTLLSRQSFGIYLLHAIPLFLLSKSQIMNLSGILASLVIFSIVIVSCNLLIFLVSKISKKLAFWLFYTRD